MLLMPQVYTWVYAYGKRAERAKGLQSLARWQKADPSPPHRLLTSWRGEACRSAAPLDSRSILAILAGRAESMKKLRIVVSLPNDNRYQHEQAVAAKLTGERLHVDAQVVHANDDPITQSQQLLEMIQSRPESRPDAVIVEPVTGTGLRRVAQTAVTSGIAWVISNCDVDYADELRKSSRVPVFAVSQGQTEVGRIQGRQIAVLLPQGGSVLYLQGPSASSVSRQRSDGMESTKPANVQIRNLRSHWNEESAYQAVNSWLRLATAHAENFDLIAGQTHELAIGARKALQDHQDQEQRARWLSLPFIGIGIRSHTQHLVDRRTLTAAVITSVTMPAALEMLVRALETQIRPRDHTLVESSSYPSLEKLAENNKILQKQ
jgi:ribose transport system substrate-binding protein